MAKEPNRSAQSFPIIVFADGASSGNPGPGGWGTIIATPEGQVKELGGSVRSTTNNQMELTAVIQGLLAIKRLKGAVGVYTDSTYVIRGITQWVWAWRNRDWKTAEGKDVANIEYWKELFALCAQRGKADPISWHYVRGHVGVPGNERVDAIAVSFSKGQRIDLYQGPLLKYEVAIHDIPEDTSLPEQKDLNLRRGPKPVAFSYLSLLGNTPVRHVSWADCEKRVKGVSGAKFKKAMSESEEDEILKSWGLDRKNLKQN